MNLLRTHGEPYITHYFSKRCRDSNSALLLSGRKLKRDEFSRLIEYLREGEDVRTEETLFLLTR